MTTSSHADQFPWAGHSFPEEAGSHAPDRIIPNLDREGRRFGRWPAGTVDEVMSLHRTRLMWLWNAAPTKGDAGTL